VAQIGNAFGMKVIAWSQNLTTERVAEVGAIRVSKDELFEEADILSIHLVLSRMTRGFVGETELALMKPTARLINTSRAPIVVEADLIAAHICRWLDRQAAARGDTPHQQSEK
jgi:phosphoglycerate dehydrogenase-like enzyme